MKVCLNSRVSNQYLEKADEIKVLYRDIKSLFDIIDKYPNKTIILELPFYAEEEKINWEELKIANKLLKGNLIICCFSLKIAQLAKSFQIKFYFGFQINSYYQLQSIKNLGVCYVRLGEELFFDIKNAAKIGVPIRLFPTLAYIDGFPRKDGVCGMWIRPEDLHFYEEYADIIEFEDAKPTKEQALYRIYMEQKKWPGDLGLIITNLNYIGLNRLILPEVTEKRLTCRQACQRTSTCKLCYRALDLANKEDLTEYAEAVNLI